MLEQLKYINHVNEVFEFGKDGVFINTNDLHDYEWDVTTKNDRISSFDYTVTKKKLPIIIVCDTEAQGVAVKNRLLEVTEKDVLSMKPGKFVIGDYYLKCYVSESQKADYLTSKRYMTVTLTLISDQPYWVKETTAMFRTELSTTVGGQNLDYLFDFPFDYSSDEANGNLNNTAFVGTNFRMVIYGPATDPEITIGGHTYLVSCDIAEGEYLTIDSVQKTIFLTGITGEVTNKFNQRGRDSYIFEKIPAGSNSVFWGGAFNFDVVLLEERSEPKWT